MTRQIRSMWLALLLPLLLSLGLVFAAPKVKPPPPTNPPAAGQKALILYDAPAGDTYEKFGMSYAIMLRNLLGHFDAQVDLRPMHTYTAGLLNGYDATFYLGSYYDHAPPNTFLADAAATPKTLVWFKYNIWHLAGNPDWNFAATRGISFTGLRGLNAVPTSSNPEPGFFDTIRYKGKDFVKYYAYDGNNNVVNADPDVGVVAIADATKASTVVSVFNPKAGESAPYVVRSGKFWYVADVPLSYIGPRDRYLVLTDLLHDMLDINHAESHKAMVRLEDVGAMVSVQTMKDLSDYLKSQQVPFSIATIPRYEDPLGVYNEGVAQTVQMSQATNLKTSLNYALARGAEIIMHGYTHQYSNLRNPYSAVSGDDFEFWNIVQNAPVAEDSERWVKGRLDAGLRDLKNNGYTPVAWETPHYQASAVTSRTVPQLFKNTYQRVVYYTADQPNFAAATGKDFAVGQSFPYVINRDHYGQRVLPENLGNIEYDIRHIDPTATINYTWEDILTNAQYALTVRDGYASFFFHPFLLEPELGVPGFEDFKKVITGISALGFAWVAPTGVPQ